MKVERRCLVIDEQPTVRLGVRELLGGRYEVEEAEDGHGALELITSLGEFDVTIVELAAGADRAGAGLTGIPAIRALRKARPGLGIVAHGARAERHEVGEALRAGATAFVAKCSPSRALSEAVDAAAESERFVDPAAQPNGQLKLTRRQREILQLYANGCSTLEVAHRLDRSAETIRTHSKCMLSRLEARDRAHAVAIGLRSSLID